MQQHIVLWGEIGTDRKALIAIDLNDEQKKVLIYAFPKDEVTDKIQDDLFQIWKNGGEYTFPENVLKWEIKELDKAVLPEGLSVEKPEILTKAYANWLSKLNSLRVVETYAESLNLLKQKILLVKEFDDNLWNETKEKWQEILQAYSKNVLSISQREILKLDIDEIFEGLKAFKRINKESDFEVSQINFKALTKKIEYCKERLIYPDEWSKTFDTLKNIQKEIKDLPLTHKHNRILFNQLNTVFNEYKKYRETENQNRTKQRISELKNIVKKIQEGIEKDKEIYKQQFEKMVFYTKGKLSDKEIEERLKDSKKDSKVQIDKIKSIQKTIKSLEKSLEKKPEKKVKQNNTPQKDEGTETKVESSEIVPKSEEKESQ
jgi:hypothetical protein